MTQCYDCRFYEGNLSSGSCKRYAPQPKPVEKEYNISLTAWPTVCSNDWCGEFKQRGVTVSTTSEAKP